MRIRTVVASKARLRGLRLCDLRLLRTFYPTSIKGFNLSGKLSKVRNSTTFRALSCLCFTSGQSHTQNRYSVSKKYASTVCYLEVHYFLTLYTGDTSKDSSKNEFAKEASGTVPPDFSNNSFNFAESLL